MPTKRGHSLAASSTLPKRCQLAPPTAPRVRDWDTCLGFCRRWPSSRLHGPWTEEPSHPELSLTTWRLSLRTKCPSVSPSYGSHPSFGPGERLAANLLPPSQALSRSLRHAPPHQQAHSRRSGNALGEEERATSCPQADCASTGPPARRLRPCGIPEGGGRRKEVPAPPLPRWAGPSPQRRRPSPRGVGVAGRARLKVCFLPPGGGGGRGAR